jgi:hypothetical protein
MVILPSSMRRARHPIAWAALVAATFVPSAPATAGAASPQIYVGSNPSYTIAFKTEASRTSLLAFNAPIYCTFTHPTERIPGTAYMVQAPTPMHKGRNGLEAPLHPAGGQLSYVRASLAGEKLAGTVALDADEGSAQCQTVGFKPASPAFQFTAAPYEPAAGGVMRAPKNGEIPVYYGNEGGVEVLLETVHGQVDFRGAAPSDCPFAGKQVTGSRAPLFGDIEGAVLSADGSFDHTFHRHGKIGGKTWSEATTVSGVAGSQEISGSYERTTKIQPKNGAPRTCSTGALPFKALRYLRAMP